MRRAHSVHQMKEYLKARTENAEHAAAVLQRLREHNYIDDARYARDFARVRAQGRRQGKFRIARELRARGVPDRHIEAALEAVFAETDESASVRSSLERKLRRLRGPLDERKRASIYRSLLRAGFSADTIRTELGAATKAAAAETGKILAFPEPSGEDV
jgi:regulatory protein